MCPIVQSTISLIEKKNTNCIQELFIRNIPKNDKDKDNEIIFSMTNITLETTDLSVVKLNS